jgi:hypothetical protein
MAIKIHLVHLCSRVSSQIRAFQLTILMTCLSLDGPKLVAHFFQKCYASGSRFLGDTTKRGLRAWYDKISHITNWLWSQFMPWSIHQGGSDWRSCSDIPLSAKDRSPDRFWASVRHPMEVNYPPSIESHEAAMLLTVELHCISSVWGKMATTRSHRGLS